MPTITVTTPAEIGSGSFALTANTEHVIDFTSDLRQVEIGVVDPTAVVWVSVNGVAATAGGKHCYPLPAVTGTRKLDIPTQGNTKVRLITTGTCATTWVVRADQWDVNQV
jgi:hypothetical protein